MTNDIESFWSYCKKRLSKFNGILKHKFEGYLKESEFRFNCGLQKLDVYKIIKKTCEKLYFAWVDPNGYTPTFRHSRG